LALHVGRSRLPELLNERNMTQAEFARRIGVSNPFITQIIKGDSVFSLSKAKIAADVLKCTINDLYDWKRY
jgi:transcriptional regulator with XRE-family HTH domain